MCGIFGIVVKKDGAPSPDSIGKDIETLFKLSESRGREASGLATHSQDSIRVIKSPVPASELVQRREYADFLRQYFEAKSPGTYALIGHSRLVTNGIEVNNYNNQPVISSGLVGVHNGIICNHEQLWKQNPDLKRQFEIDTESLFALIQKHLAQGQSIAAACARSYRDIEGAATLAFFLESQNALVLTTNTGSLYVDQATDHSALVFGSEHLIVSRYAAASGTGIRWCGKPQQVRPGSGLIIHLDTLKIETFTFDQPSAGHASESTKQVELVPDFIQYRGLASVMDETEVIVPAKWQSLVEGWDHRIRALRRCTQCIMPETMPFIAFDTQGVCNFCRNYTPLKPKGLAALKEKVEGFKGKGDVADCLATFSGGRDSSYGLGLAKRELGLHPLAYTYDWGMITDLGRRNQARLTGKLGIEHILVSADIRKKRRFIRMNVEAWLKRPRLGTIPLFMAGDKQFFYYAMKLMKETGIRLVMFCFNHLEKTDFKSGFCGIRPNFGEKSVYRLTLGSKLRMIGYYAKEAILNPAYINASLFDSIGAFFSFYGIKHEYVNVFDYIPWEEKQIEQRIFGEYNWELAKDTKSSWRIGDGTASFYNYIYYTVAGFTENDTFRSNQIRQGLLDRATALELVRDENRPRWNSIKWYCDTVGVDFHKAIETINGMPRLYDLAKP